MHEQTPPEQIQTGFNRPRVPEDNYAAGLYERHGLDEAPSLEDIEPVAIRLLDDPRTALEGMEMVMGRRIDAKELRRNPFLGSIALMRGAPEKFGGLLLLKAIEETQDDQA